MFRAVISSAINRSTATTNNVHRRFAQQILIEQGKRGFSYYDSEHEAHPSQYTDFEKSYAEWKWVERLIAPKTVPCPPSDPSLTFSSGWKAPNIPKNAKYIVRRTKNHMIPVYTIIYDRGQIRETRIKFIEGDIWALERDIGRYIQKQYPKRVCMTYTNEVSRHVGIRGDYTEEIKEWLMNKGF